MLIYGAHLLRNGAARILERMMAGGLADSPGHQRRRHHSRLGIRLAGRFDRIRLRQRRHRHVRNLARNRVEHSPRPDGRRARRPRLRPGPGPLHPGRRRHAASALRACRRYRARALRIRSRPPAPICSGRCASRTGPKGGTPFNHRWKHASILAQAARHDVPLTVHPGIGYDIIANHPVFNGAAIGRAAERDFKLFGGSLRNLEGGVVLSIGSAIMGPQVFEKALSCVNNLRLQAGQGVIRGHSFYVVDLQDGGNWDWTKGEPPKNNPAYYLRFCKSYSRMGGALHYVQADNLMFVHHLFDRLQGP